VSLIDVLKTILQDQRWEVFASSVAFYITFPSLHPLKLIKSDNSILTQKRPRYHSSSANIGSALLFPASSIPLP
jgi:hypothetical protein